MSDFVSSRMRAFRVVLLLALSVQMVSGAEPTKGAEPAKGAGAKAAEAGAVTNHTPGANMILGPGEHQEVETPTHVFRFFRDARVEVAIKKDDAFVGKPIELSLGAGYTDANRTWHGRPIKDYVVEPEWDAKTQSVLHQMTLDDNVRADVYYQVKAGVLYVGLSVKEPSSLSFPGSYCVGVSQFDVMAFDGESNLYKGWPAPEGVPTDKLAATLKGMQVGIKCTKENQVIYPYAKGIPHFIIGVIDEVAVSGVYGKRVFFLYPSASNGFISPYIYPGNAPCQGYAMAFHKKELRHSATSSSELMRLIVK